MKRKDDCPCPYCGETMNDRYEERWNHFMNCPKAKEQMVEGVDYLVCPVCGVWKSELSYHLSFVHGINKKKRMKLYSDLKVRCEAYKKKIGETNIEKYGSVSPMGNKEIRDKARHVFQDKYGVDNPFASEEVQKKIKRTNKERYGVEHPMQNEDVFIRQQDSANASPNLLEQFFDEHTCNNVVFVGYGGKYVRTKTGVHKYGRLIKDLCPDFMVFSDNIIESARDRSGQKKRMDPKKHRSRYVIELLGDYYHSEKVIGVSKEDHEREIIAAYASANIQCLVIWEEDIKGRWNEIEEEIGTWIKNAVEDMNQRPIYKKTTKHKIDKRKANFVCPMSGERFKTQDKLDEWMVSKKNLYRPGLVEGKDFVVCRICGKRFKKLGSHIRRDHGLSVKDYKFKYPDSILLTEKEKSRISRENKAKGSGRKYKQRVVYRTPDGLIVKKKDAWIKAWGVNSPPEDSIINASTVNLDPWKDKIEGIDYIVCKECGYKGRNISRHVKREHNIDKYDGELKSESCKKALSDASNMAWETKKKMNKVE